MHLEWLLNIDELKNAPDADLSNVNNILLNYFPKHMLASHFSANMRRAKRYKLASASAAAILLPSGIFFLFQDVLRQYGGTIATVGAIAANSYTSYKAKEKTYAALEERLLHLNHGLPEARVSKLEYIINFGELGGASDANLLEIIRTAVRHADGRELVRRAEKLKGQYNSFKRAALSITAAGILAMTYFTIMAPSLVVIDALVAFAGVSVYVQYSRLEKIYSKILEHIKI